jgi:hypothetical protein
LPLPRFNRPELERFLIEIDRALTTPGRVVVIGGAAAILQYRATRSTVDIDTYSAGPAGLEDAIRAAWVTTGLEISVQYAAVADAPFNYEDRLVRLASPRLERLEVMVPERHDLALMKVTRGEERDLVVLDEMHALEPFDLETLVTRYLDELTHAMQDPRILRQKFLLFTQRLFGSKVADKTRDRIIRVPVERELGATTAVVNGRALYRLGIRPETIADERFAGTIRQDSTGAIVFPMRDAAGAVALRLETPLGSVVRGEAELGLWSSPTNATDTSLVVVSDPLDAVALHQHVSDPHARYVATAAVGKHQSRLLREAIRSLAADGRLLLAFPRDQTGDRLAAEVGALEPRRPMLRHLPPRLGSWRLFVQDAEREWIRSQGF